MGTSPPNRTFLEALPLVRAGGNEWLSALFLNLHNQLVVLIANQSSMKMQHGTGGDVYLVCPALPCLKKMDRSGGKICASLFPKKLTKQEKNGVHVGDPLRN